MIALVLIDFHNSVYKVFFLPLSQLIISILPSTYLIQSNSRPVNKQTLHQQWSGKVVEWQVSHIPTWSGLTDFFSVSLLSFFLESDTKGFTAFFFYIILEQNPRMFRIQNKIKQASPFLCSKKMGKFYISKTKKIGYVNPFADEATPGFELGKKDLQSPALPLGHAAKTIQNIPNPLKKRFFPFYYYFFFFLLKKSKGHFQPQNKKVRTNWNP